MRTPDLRHRPLMRFGSRVSCAANQASRVWKKIMRNASPGGARARERGPERAERRTGASILMIFDEAQVLAIPFSIAQFRPDPRAR